MTPDPKFPGDPLFPATRASIIDAAHRLAEGKAEAGAPRRRLVGSRPMLALAAVVVLLVVVGVGWLRTGSVQEPFAERAYAAAAPSGLVTHFVIHVRLQRGDGTTQLDRRYETWIRRDRRFATVEAFRDPATAPRTVVVVADASVRTTWVDGKQTERVAGAPDPTRAGVFDPDAYFRRLYEAGSVKDAGTVSDDGSIARRFSMRDGDQSITYDVDARTLRPLRWVIRGRDVTDSARRTTNVVTIERYDRTTAFPSTASLLRR